MRNHISRLAILAAVSLVMPITTSSAQGMTLPRPLAAALASTVPDRLFARRADLELTEAQARELAALSAKLHAEELIQAQSSKSWITAERRPSPQRAFDRALAMLTPAQRAPAIRVLASAEEAAP